MHPLSPRTLLPARHGSATLPPPVPPVARVSSASLIDDTADDVRRLTDEIDRVLTGRPTERRAHVHSLSAVLAGAASNVAEETSAAGAEPFDWFAADKRNGTIPVNRSAGWVSQAKRERRFHRIRSVVSWIVATGLAVAIAGVAAIVVQGGLPEADNIERAIRALGL